MSDETETKAEGHTKTSDATTAAILEEVRPYLSPALQRLPDEKLLALIHWDIFTAWERAIRDLASK